MKYDGVTVYDPLYVEAGVECVIYGVWYLPHAVIGFSRVQFMGFVYFSFYGLCVGGVYCCMSMC
jgi:hypothetical protein